MMVKSLDFLSLRRLPSLAVPVNDRGVAATAEIKASVFINRSSSKPETSCYSLASRRSALPHPGCLPRCLKPRRNTLNPIRFRIPTGSLGYSLFPQGNISTEQKTSHLSPCQCPKDGRHMDQNQASACSMRRRFLYFSTWT
jgi:hypothetical protein